MSDMVLTLKITADGKIAVQEVQNVDSAVKNMGGSAAAAGAAGAQGLKRYADGAKGAAQEQDGMTASVFKGVSAMEVARRAYDQAVQVFHEMVAATEQAQLSHARLQAVLRATGSTAGQTADDVERLVTQLAGKTIFDDTQLRNAATTLTTFDRLSSEAFEHILKLSADLASTGRGDLDTWVEVLAKAGSEPALSIGLVERSFGKLSPTLKVAIQDAADFNDRARATQLLMQALDQRVGGTSTETYRGLTRQIEGTKKAWDDLLIAMGNKVFDAQSSDASRLETDLRNLKAFLDEDHWFSKLWDVMTGNHAATGGYSSPRDQLIGQLGDYRAALAAAQANPVQGQEAYVLRLQATIARLQARVDAMPRVAAPPRNLGPVNFFPEGDTGEPESVAAGGSNITKLEQQQLYVDQLRGLSAYLDQVYAIRQQGTQRELAIEQFKHDAFLESDQKYFANVERLQQQAAQDEVARLQSAVAIQERVVANAGANVARVSQGDHPDTEIAAARQQEQAENQKLLGLRGQLIDAEGKLGDAARTRGQNETLANNKLRDELTAINRSYEDYLKNLDRSIDDMALEVNLIGQDAEAQAKARKEHELRNAQYDLQDKLFRQLMDEMQHANRPQVIADLTKQMVDLGEKTDEAIAKWDELISKQFRKQAVADLSSALADALLTGGKQGLEGIKAAFEDYFKKPVKVKLEAEINKIIGGALNTIYANYAQATGLTAAQAQQQLGFYGAAGGIFGGVAAGAAGAGNRGAALAASYGSAGAMGGAYLGAQYGSSYGVYGAIIGAVVGAIAGIASDPKGAAERYAYFGDSPSGHYQYQRRDAFGTIGTFNTQAFSDQDMGQSLRAFMSSLSTTENALAAMLRPGELQRVQAAFAGWSTQYDFGKEHGDFSEALTQITKDRMAKMIDTVMPGFGRLIEASQGTAEEIVNLAQALLGLRDAGKTIQDAITQISGTAVEQMQMTIDSLNTKVSKAQEDFSAALESNDPTRILPAEQALQQAIVNRYQQEISMVRQIQATIRQIEQQAYQFSLNIAQRIASVGGSDLSASVAMGRATSLRDRITTSGEPVNFRVEDIQSYVGAIDDWYNARKAQIEADLQSQQEAARAIAQAQITAAQAREDQLQKELDLAKSFQGVVDRTRQMLDELRFSSSNPAPITARIGLAQANVRDLYAQYQGATGQGRVDLANQLLDALQTYEQLGQQGYQRPSPEWQAIYNEISADLTAVQKDAKSYAQQSAELEASILGVQQQIQQYQQDIANASNASAHALDALNAETLPYYQWAQQHGEADFAQQEQDQRDLLMAITGGTDPEIFIAARQQESVELLKSIDTRIAAWLAANGNTAGDSSTNPLARGDTVGGSTGASPDGSNPLARGGSSSTSGNPKGATVQLTINLQPGEDLMSGIQRHAPAIKRVLARA